MLQKPWVVSRSIVLNAVMLSLRYCVLFHMSCCICSCLDILRNPLDFILLYTLMMLSIPFHLGATLVLLDSSSPIMALYLHRQQLLFGKDIMGLTLGQEPLRLISWMAKILLL